VVRGSRLSLSILSQVSRVGRRRAPEPASAGFTLNAGVVGSCGDTSVNRDFTASASLFNLTTPAVGLVASRTGVVILASSAR
jgi:hypothetical protein